MEYKDILFELVLIFAGASVLSTVFLYFKQPIILSYIFLGMLIGPYGFGLLNQVDRVEKISHLGIILLLFLIGLNLHPNKLYTLFRKAFLITISTCSVFAFVSGAIAFTFGFSLFDSLLVGLALMFSSTLIGVKLIPTTDLHHKHIGGMMISVLLLQDIFAIIIIVLMSGEANADMRIFVPFLLLKVSLLTVFAFLFVKYCMLALFLKFDVIQEYLLVASLGWCLLMAGLANLLGLSYEIGSFIAGISIAISPVSLVISEKLKSIREFFLILFFFAIGAQFNFLALEHILLPSILISTFLLAVKPFIFFKAFRISGESARFSQELGLRLGQASEFSLLVAYAAFINGKILGETSQLIQLTVIITFIVSTYVVVSKYATPIASTDKHRRD